MKSPLARLLFGSVLAALTAANAFAQAPQTTPAPNPFGAGQPPAAPAPRKPRATALQPGQFATEAEAKANCPGQPVVWANTSTKIYHHAGSRAYGTTKRGAYMCEKDTAAAGIRAAKNER